MNIYSLALLCGSAVGLMASVCWAQGADTDACTYDFAAISKAKFGNEDTSAPNVLSDPLGFKKDRAYVWHPDEKADLPSTNRRIDEAMVAESERDNGLFAMLSPESLIGITGGTGCGNDCGCC